MILRQSFSRLGSSRGNRRRNGIENTTTQSRQVYKPGCDTPGIPDAEPDDTGRYQSDLPPSKPQEHGEGAGFDPGEPGRTRDHPAVERRARDSALSHGAEPDPLRLAPPVPIRLGQRARRRSATGWGARALSGYSA